MPGPGDGATAGSDRRPGDGGCGRPAPGVGPPRRDRGWDSRPNARDAGPAHPSRPPTSEVAGRRQGGGSSGRSAAGSASAGPPAPSGRPGESRPCRSRQPQGLPRLIVGDGRLTADQAPDGLLHVHPVLQLGEEPGILDGHDGDRVLPDRRVLVGQSRLSRRYASRLPELAKCAG